MSSTMTNSTNSSVPTTVSSTASAALPQSASSNTTSNNSTGQTNATATDSNDSSTMTLLTFGPLSSCIDLPNLSASTVPSTVNLSDASRQRAIQSWLTSLPTTSSCTTLSWRFQPDYSQHLDVMSTFQSQLEQLFPSAANASSTGEISGFGSTSTVNASSGSSNTTFFPSTPSTSGLTASTSTSGTLPATLPLWIGITLGCATLVHLLAFILHTCSDLDALFPSLATKLRSDPEQEVLELPRHTQQPNDSSTTLVEEESDDGDGKVSDPPRYSEPSTSQGAVAGKGGVGGGMGETPALMRMARKCKKVMVPLLLVSALGMVGVAVVLNAKFAVGPVGSFSSSSLAAVEPVSSSSASSVSTTGASGTSVAAATMSASISSSGDGGSRGHHVAGDTSRSADTVSSTAAQSKVDEGEKASASTSAPAVAPTSSMIRLVRRQTNFFPTPSSTASPPTNDSTSSPSASVSTSAPSSTPTPNASLFPTITTTLSSSAFTAQPTTSTSSPSPPASTSTTSTNSSSTPSLFVLQRGSSIHKLWWIVMLDLLLWFAQRRRTRSQTALDKARSFVISQLTASSKKS